MLRYITPFCYATPSCIHFLAKLTTLILLINKQLNTIYYKGNIRELYPWCAGYYTTYFFQAKLWNWNRVLMACNPLPNPLSLTSVMDMCSISTILALTVSGHLSRLPYCWTKQRTLRGCIKIGWPSSPVREGCKQIYISKMRPSGNRMLCRSLHF